MRYEPTAAPPSPPVADLAGDYRLFLDLLRGLGGGIDLQPDDGWTQVTWRDEVLCACRRRDDTVQLFLGPDREKALRCESHEDFEEVLAVIMRRLWHGPD